MTDPEEQPEAGEQDELELEPETVKDLEPGRDAAEDVRGGALGSVVACGSWVGCE
jgi:hypothetical protein